jgi:hypothetical protein
MKYRPSLISMVLLLISSQPLPAQDGAMSEVILPSLTKQRAGNALNNHIHFSKLSATKFLPVLSIIGTGSWESPRTVFTIDGIPYRTFAAGIPSVDLVPLDLIVIDSITTNRHTGVDRSSPTPGGILHLHRQAMPDSLAIGVRLFTGSETGDPLVHLFTRPEMRHVNINKVGPSFALSAGNRSGNWSYRISGGGFFYFSTGSVNDVSIGRYSSELVNRQNRQVKVTAEAGYRIDDSRELNLFASGINLFGWEMSPFSSLFNHYAGIGGTARIGYIDRVSGLRVTVSRDEMFTRSKEINGTPAYGWRATTYGVYPLLRRRAFGNTDLTFSAHAELLRAEDDTDVASTERQHILSDEVAEGNWGIGFGLERRSAVTFSYYGKVRVDGHAVYAPAISGEASFEFPLKNMYSVRLHAGSAVYFPNYMERYGIMQTTRQRTRSELPDTFYISGNPDLAVERTNELMLIFVSGERVNYFDCEAAIFGRWTHSGIRHEVLRAVRTFAFEDIVRSLRYVNVGTRFIPGGILQFTFRPYSFLTVSSEHLVIDNSNDPSLPRYNGIYSVDIRFPLDIYLGAVISHSGPSTWGEFSVAAEDDDLYGTGFPGTVPATTVFDTAFGRRFGDFYFAKDLDIRLQATNLFNAPVRRIPVGNYLTRAVFVYVSFGL